MLSAESTSKEHRIIGQCGKVAMDESHFDASDSEDVSSIEISTPPKQQRSSAKKTRRHHGEGISSQRSGHWDEDENRKYFLFLQDHHTNFQRKNLRRSEKIFKVMSRYLGTRTADQCRSHHQKMEKKCLSFQKILEHLAENYSDCVLPRLLTKDGNTRPRRDYVPRVFRSDPTSSSQDQLKETDSPITATTNDQEEYVMPSLLEPLYNLPTSLEHFSLKLRLMNST